MAAFSEIPASILTKMRATRATLDAQIPSGWSYKLCWYPATQNFCTLTVGGPGSPRIAMEVATPDCAMISGGRTMSYDATQIIDMTVGQGAIDQAVIDLIARAAIPPSQRV